MIGEKRRIEIIKREKRSIEIMIGEKRRIECQNQGC
jgi:hypothetical protein